MWLLVVFMLQFQTEHVYPWTDLYLDLRRSCAWYDAYHISLVKFTELIDDTWINFVTSSRLNNEI